MVDKLNNHTCRWGWSLMLRRSLGLVMVGAVLLAFHTSQPARAAGEHVEIDRLDWTFGGPFGYFDQAQLQRGYQVYAQVCAACHGLRLLSYRNLGEPGGPEFSEERVQQIAAEAMVTDGPDENGEMFQRPGRPSDRFVEPYRNKQEAALVNNGVAPPDLSVMAKARTVTSNAAWYMQPYVILRDMVTMYEEQGPDYLHALLTGYSDTPPDGIELSPGMNYNRVYPGNLIAMAQPLYDDMVPYEDGTPTTIDQYAKDVTAFMMWAAEPRLEERKKLGLKVLIYLFILTVLLYLSKRALWSRVKH
jgi:cytochrome c1